MRALALFFVAAACASARAPAPAGRPVQDDELARIPDVPASELAKRIIEAQEPRGSDVTDTFMVVEVNLKSADNARVRSALAVLEAMAASIDRKYRELSEEDDQPEGIEELVDHVREVLDQRLETAPCSLVFAVEHAAGEFNHLPGYVPVMARHSSAREHRLSVRTISCVMKSIEEKIAACDAKHKGDAMVDIVVSKEGTVTWAVTIGKLANTPTGDCVAAAVTTATFPPSDEVSGFTYPHY